uniref:Uncharacterized protein n=1 Tax=Timema bartmani TaxID=61472 RepID=A0A7R9EVL3_9NEOP|nr:unnamed protein product [Timema bartmani]
METLICDHILILRPILVIHTCLNVQYLDIVSNDNCDCLLDVAHIKPGPLKVDLLIVVACPQESDSSSDAQTSTSSTRALQKIRWYDELSVTYTVDLDVGFQRSSANYGPHP